MMGLLDAFKQYVRDAMPGGALNPEVTKQGLLDTAAVATTPVPVLGDLLGLAADVKRLKDNPDERTPMNIGLSALGVLPFVPSLAGMFVGKGSKTWDALSAAKAQEMASNGVDPRQIWKETGTFKGPDGKWRQEIDDSAAKFVKNKLEYPYKNSPEVARTKLSSAMEHSPLYGAYPDIGAMDVVVNPKMGFTRGSYHEARIDVDLPEYFQIGLDRQSRYETAQDWLSRLKNPADPDFWKNQAKEGFDSGAFGSMREAKRDAFNYLKEQAKEVDELKNGVLWPSTDSSAKSVTLHELQHGIQQREGWARGGMPEMFSNLSPQAVNDAQLLQARISRGETPTQAAAWMKQNLGRNPDIYAMDIATSGKAFTSPKTPEEAYRRLAGEAEARATQARMNLNAAQRRELFPLDSYDVPVDQLIIRGLLD